jgi:ribosomal protein L22
MSRYYRGYRRRGYSRSYWGYQNVSERAQLSAIAGGIDKDIERIFLSLPSYKLESVFTRYGHEHGSSALSYARNTYPKWKSGSVQMSGKVAERLLNLVPIVLDSDSRFELVKKLREAHRRKIDKHVQCEPHEWRTKVAPEIAQLLASSSEFKLPDSALNRIRWLTDGDSQAAQRLLAAAEEEEAIARLRHLELEFRRIDALIQSIQGRKTVSHIITLPQGTVSVRIGQPQNSGCLSILCVLFIPILIFIIL